MSFKDRLFSTLAFDFKRMFKSSLFYIFSLISLVIPILILVMTTMMDGSISVNPETGDETVIEGFNSVWEIIGSKSGSTSSSMDIMSMCNINLMYFLIIVFIVIFICEDFRSGYIKSLFSIRVSKLDYVISKILIGFVSGAIMIICFFIGSMFGGLFSGLSFELDGVSIGQVVMCILAKVFLVSLFSGIGLLAGAIGKQKLWLSIIIAGCICMLLFMMIPTITPLDSSILNVILCLIGGILFSIGFGAAGNVILNKTDLL